MSQKVLGVTFLAYTVGLPGPDYSCAGCTIWSPPPPRPGASDQPSRVEVWTCSVTQSWT